MIDVERINEAIGNINDQSSFLNELLINCLNWEINPDASEIEDTAYEYTADELELEMIDQKLNGRVLNIAFEQDIDWGVFILEFQDEDAFLQNRGLTTPLRQLLNKLVPKLRNSPDRQTWEPEDLMFICTYEYRHFRFAYFKAPKGKEKTSPLAQFGWNHEDSDIRTLCEHNLPHLQWSLEDEFQNQWREAFNIEKVTKNFYREYAFEFEKIENAIAEYNSITDKPKLRLFTQTLFNRLMFLRFIEKKGWLDFNGGQDYLKSLYNAAGIEEQSFYRARLCPLFFQALAIEGEQESEATGRVPFLNGGLFDYDEELDGLIEDIPDDAFAPVLGEDGLFYRYNFTVEESTPLDIEVAVDPEMLGKVFEELVTGRHESGSYYTPRQIVSFMCRETIKGYLCEKTSASSEAIEKLVDEHELDAGSLSDLQAQEILFYLETLKAVDPACGSGAYLLGLLHELMAIRRALQNEKLKADPAFHYELKLRAISSSLYGVDIDPFATNIAKLRLWLSLAVEADEPQPLPNLDFKIETGDAVLGPCNELTDNENLLFISDLKDRAEALVVKKDEYMTAHGERKKTLYEEIKAEEAQIASETSTAYGEGIIAWYIHFAEVFMTTRRQQEIQKGVEGLDDYQVTVSEPAGFDIVLANPPYIRQELIKDIKPRLQEVYPVTFSGTADLYTYFYTRAVELLGPGGMLSFISPNKWFRANYGKKIRRYLADKCTVHSITDFQDSPVFEGATAYPMIFVAQKGNIAHSTIYTETKVPNGNIDVKAVIKENGRFLDENSIRGENWSFIDRETAVLIEKMQINSVPLGIYVKGQIARGILTGFNKAFVIDAKKREELIADDPASEDIIKPMCTGKEIKRWTYNSPEQWLILSKNKGDTKEYPAVMSHLSEYKRQLTLRQDQGDNWWELRACSFYHIFEEPKIVYSQIMIRSEFAYVDAGVYTNQKCFSIPLSDKFLLGILNSAAVWLLLSVKSPCLRGGYIEPRKELILSIPIPKASSNLKKKIEKLVQKCLDAKGQNCEKWEKEIDKIATKLYGIEGFDG